MNTIIVNESDLDFEKYDGCASPFMFDNFNLVVYTKTNEKLKIQVRTGENGLIYKINEGIWLGIRAVKSMKEIYPEEGQMSVCLDENGDVMIGRFFIPVGYNDEEEDEFVINQIFTSDGYEAYLNVSQWLCNILCSLMMMGKDERNRRQTKVKHTEHNAIQAKKGSNKKQKVFLMQDIVNYIADNYIEGKAHTISCPCWEVRGHYRHYKSGKVVFIKPFKKGKEKATAIPKAKEYYV